MQGKVSASLKNTKTKDSSTSAGTHFPYLSFAKVAPFGKKPKFMR